MPAKSSPPCFQVNTLADATWHPILPSDSFPLFVPIFPLWGSTLWSSLPLKPFHYLSSKNMTLTNLEPDVMQRAWVPHGAQDVGKLYFHQGGGAVVYSLQRAPPETSVRETALPFLRVKLAGTWGRRVTRWQAQLTTSLRRGSTSCFHFKLTLPALIPVLRESLLWQLSSMVSNWVVATGGQTMTWFEQ